MNFGSKYVYTYDDSEEESISGSESDSGIVAAAGVRASRSFSSDSSDSDDAAPAYGDYGGVAAAGGIFSSVKKGIQRGETIGVS